MEDSVVAISSRVRINFRQSTQELYSGGKDNNVLVWSAPLPAHGDVPAAKADAQGSCEEPSPQQHFDPFADAWSDDEDGG